MVNSYNYKYLERLVDDQGNLQPIQIIKAIDIDIGYIKVSSCKVGFLEICIPLGIGAWIMFLKNL